MPSRRAALKSLLSTLALLLGAPAAALGQCPQTSLADIEDEVTCPVCGVPLELATEAPQAQRQRQFIVERIERCQSKEEIKAALVAEFGEEVLATPVDEGFDLAAYIVPALAVVAGVGVITLAALRWRRTRAPTSRTATDSPAAPSRDEAARLDRDLERYEL